jgi:SAM-dependent methyltransferase
MADIQQVKQGMKATWMTGDFGQIAHHSAAEAERFVQRLGLKAGQRVLDVACGTGNTAIPEAKLGCAVVGVDIATNLLEQARERAQQEGVQADFVEGDAEALQFPDMSFDAVVTMFGAMFAPRPELVAREFVRVCRPGGLIAMANWTPTGFVGKMFRLGAEFAPPPPDIPPPAQWGVAEIVQQRLGDQVKVEAKPVRFNFDYPMSPEGTFEFFKRYFGPTQVTWSKLDPQRQQEFKAAMVKLWSEHNQAKEPERTLVEVEYLEVRGRKKG